MSEQILRLRLPEGISDAPEIVKEIALYAIKNNATIRVIMPTRTDPILIVNGKVVAIWI